jgi:kumamolisin
MPPKSRTAVSGSQRAMLPNAKAVGPVDPNERIEITIMVRPRVAAGDAKSRSINAISLSERLPENREYLSREDFANQRGADAEDLAKIENFAHEHNLTVVQTSIPERMIKLSGTLADLTAAFSPNLKEYKVGKIMFRGRTGPVSVPEDLKDIVVGVFGFDNRPVARPHYRALGWGGGPRSRRGAVQKTERKAAKARVATSATVVSPRNAPNGSFLAMDVGKLYNFPSGLDGGGQCIALVELNTKNQSGQVGTGFSNNDLKVYFAELGISSPKVTAVGVDHGANLPGVNLNADGEVTLDIEVAGAIAPGAEIAVYFAPNTDKGFIDVISAAVHDSVRRPSVVSISWGGPEDPPFTSDQSRMAIDQIFQDAAALGVTVCCASGDDGSSDLPLKDDQGNQVRDNKPHADFPSSSPFALACGGTKLVGTATTISSESVWNEGDPRGPEKPSGSGGGGVSNFFPKPSYQSGLSIPTSPQGKTGRGLPDVAGNADPATGYRVRVAGRTFPVGGTSAVAPLWAGLVALINQRLESLGKKPCGFLNPVIYQSPSAFRDIVDGNNDIGGTLGKYRAGIGWDCCTGLGTPDGSKVMAILGG